MSDGKKEILLGDCLELMKDIPNGSIDMILCDLPYGVTKNKWDSVIDLESLWYQYKRIRKDNAPIILFAQTPFDKVLGVSNIDELKYEWIWDKVSTSGHLNAKKMPLKAHENILVFYKKPPTYTPQKTQRTEKEIRRGWKDKTYTILTFSNGNGWSKKKAIHPTQKPVSLFEYLIKTYTNDGDTVLDNCAGSGTTAIACLNTNRHFILMEQDNNYFEKIKKRVGDFNKSFSHGTLFDAGQ